MKLFLSFSLCLVVLPNWASAAGVSAEIFPALRKRKEQQQQQKAAPVLVQKNAEPVQGPTVEEAQDAPASVPAALDAGSDGYPELPAVSQMLSTASNTLKSVNSQASSLEARVVQAQMQSEAKMAKQKAAFEEKLKQQEQGNQAVITANANISAEIKDLKSGNAALKKHAREIEETNKLMRSELHTLESRLGVAKDFTSKSLTATDDSKNSLLQVLKGGRKHHHAFVETSSKTQSHAGANDDDDEDDDDKEDSDETSDDKDDDDKDDKDDDEEEGTTSFLALSSKVHRAAVADGSSAFEAAMSDLEAAVPDVPAGPAMPDSPASNPGDLLEVLSKDVAHLAQQEKESEKTLKNLFIRDFRAGAKRHQALLTQQKTLIATRSSLQALQAKLKGAEAHLEATRAQLEGRLHGLGQYLQKLAHFAMAPQHEVPHLLEVLPKTVTVKAEAKKMI
jgi:hypothetical protein